MARVKLRESEDEARVKRGEVGARLKPGEGEGETRVKARRG